MRFRSSCIVVNSSLIFPSANYKTQNHRVTLRSLSAKQWDLNLTKVFIQSLSRLADITAGGDFLGLCDQKSS